MTAHEHGERIDQLVAWGLAINHAAGVILLVGTLSTLFVESGLPMLKHILGWYTAFLVCNVANEGLMGIARWHLEQIRAEVERLQRVKRD